jgi:hypothetical protein
MEIYRNWLKMFEVWDEYELKNYQDAMDDRIKYYNCICEDLDEGKCEITDESIITNLYKVYINTFRYDYNVCQMIDRAFEKNLINDMNGDIGRVKKLNKASLDLDQKLRKIIGYSMLNYSGGLLHGILYRVFVKYHISADLIYEIVRDYYVYLTDKGEFKPDRSFVGKDEEKAVYGL